MKIFRTILILFLLVTPAVGASAAKKPSISRIGYAIQMGAFADVKNAERFTTALQKKGIEAFYYKKDNGIYAVRFGDFSSKDKARAAAAKLVEERLINSYYIAPPNEIVFSKPQGSSWQRPNYSEPGSKPADKKPVSEKQPSQGNRNDRGMGAIAARTAERFVGIPYRWGGDNVIEGMDCSGFVRAVYNLCGVNIPRTSREQYKVGELIPKSELQDGDLVFFGASENKINHVGIYVGNGKFVHAPRRGEDIKITSIDENYFEKRFIGAKRYFQP